MGAAERVNGSYKVCVDRRGCSFELEREWVSRKAVIELISDVEWIN